MFSFETVYFHVVHDRHVHFVNLTTALGDAFNLSSRSVTVIWFISQASQQHKIMLLGLINMLQAMEHPTKRKVLDLLLKLQEKEGELHSISIFYIWK